MEQIRKQEPDAPWLDDVFGEAAVAMCKDTRTLAFYDARFSAGTREMAKRMMTALWPGWTIRACRLVSEVAAAVGVDLVAEAAPSPVVRASPESICELGDVSGTEPLCAAVIHLLQAGQRHVLVSAKDPLGPLLCGPKVLDVLPDLPTLAEVRRTLVTRADSAGRPLAVLHHEAILHREPSVLLFRRGGQTLEPLRAPLFGTITQRRGPAPKGDWTAPLHRSPPLLGSLGAGRRPRAARSSRATKAGEHGLRGIDLITVGFDHPALELRELALIQLEGLVVTGRENDDLGPFRQGSVDLDVPSADPASHGVHLHQIARSHEHAAGRARP